VLLLLVAGITLYFRRLCCCCYWISFVNFVFFVSSCFVDVDLMQGQQHWSGTDLMQQQQQPKRARRFLYLRMCSNTAAVL
jgi:hypothetical protein